MSTITRCTGEGQGSCRRCERTKGWNRQWMSFLYKIDGEDGCYCADCVKVITGRYPSPTNDNK